MKIRVNPWLKVLWLRPAAALGIRVISAHFLEVSGVVSSFQFESVIIVAFLANPGASGTANSL